MYAWPSARKYPLNTRKQVHAAIAYFAAAIRRGDYSAAQRRSIGGRIRRRAAELGIHVRAF